MGIKIGPDGNIWGVNATTHELRKAVPGIVGITDIESQATWHITPNPASDQFTLLGLNESVELQIHDASGRLVLADRVSPENAHITTTAMEAGTYRVSTRYDNGTVETRVLVVTR